MLYAVRARARAGGEGWKAVVKPLPQGERRAFSRSCSQGLVLSALTDVHLSSAADRGGLQGSFCGEPLQRLDCTWNIRAGAHQGQAVLSFPDSVWFLLTRAELVYKLMDKDLPVQGWQPPALPCSSTQG